MQIKTHQYWFLTSADGGDHWQLTEGPFTEAEAEQVKGGMEGQWVMVEVASIEGYPLSEQGKA
jgi:hypothetical protein